MFKTTFLLGIILTLFVGSNSPTDPEWEFITEEDGIIVHSRLMDDSPFKEIKIETEAYANFEDLDILFNDVPGFTNWVFKCIEAERVETVDHNSFIYYLQTDLPFPVSNRDMVVLSTQTYNADLNRVTSVSVPVPDAYPVRKGVVRIQEFYSTWQLDMVEQGKLKITYQARTDPAGFIPAWMVNLALASGPLNTMRAFKNKLENMSEVQSAGLEKN